MKFRKITAAIAAAAVLAVATPMTGVLPDVLGVTASAEGQFKVGDVFCAFLDDNGNIHAVHDSVEDGSYVCTVKPDGTLKIKTYLIHPLGGVLVAAYPGKTVAIPSEIAGHTVSEIESARGLGCKKVIIPDTVKIIGQSAFADQVLLKEVEFSGNSQLELIDQWAFQDCRSLETITIPASVETIAYGAFLNTDKIEARDFLAMNSAPAENFDLDAEYGFTRGDIETNSGWKGEGYIISDRYSLTTVNFAKGSKLKTIGEYAFANQYALKSIEIPASVTAIDANAFESSSLKQINGVAGSYAETFAKENGYTFNSTASETPDDTSKPTDTSNTFTDDSGDKAADIEVIAKPNVIPKEAHFSVRLDDANTTAERIAYNCYFTYNGAEYEPTDTVTVRIPVPVAMRDIADTLKVYHLQDGKYVNMSAKVENGYLVFDTDHFSTYVVTAEELDKAVVTPGDTDPATSDGGDNSDSGSGNPSTGIALAIAPVVLAASAAIVISKKRK